MNVHFREVCSARATLDYATYLKRLAALPGDVPLMIEHMKDAEEYDKSRRYLLRPGPEGRREVRVETTGTGSEPPRGLHVAPLTSPARRLSPFFASIRGSLARRRNCPQAASIRSPLRWRTLTARPARWRISAKRTTASAAGARNGRPRTGLRGSGSPAPAGRAAARPDAGRARAGR